MVSFETLRELTRKTIEAEPLNHSSSKMVWTPYLTMSAKDLRAILLTTGGEFNVIVKAKVYKCTITKKSLGLGVYNVTCSTEIPYTPL